LELGKWGKGKGKGRPKTDLTKKLDFGSQSPAGAEFMELVND